MKLFRLILILCLCMAMNAKANETTANLLQQGDSCLSRYDVFHATQYYQKYLEANPSHLEARRKLASCYRKVGNYTACISCLDKIPSDSINHEDMRMFYYAYLNQNNNDKVSLWGERIASSFPYDSEIIASLASHYNGANQPGRAEEVAKNYIYKCDSTDRKSINGKVGERFGVRNSGAIAVIEGAGDHCCEYMTGGRVVVLGETGRNFAAGMSGGVAYVWDKNHNFDYFCNMDMVEINLVEDSTYRKELHELIRQHYLYTGSKLARTMLDDWNHYVEDFIQVVPIEYKRVLQEEQVKKLQQKIADMQRDY